jgi:hypothetical protein
MICQLADQTISRRKGDAHDDASVKKRVSFTRTWNKLLDIFSWIDSLVVDGFFSCEMCPSRARHIVHFILVGPFGDSKYLEGELVCMSLIT